MKLSLYKKAKLALNASLKKGVLDQTLVSNQLNGLGNAKGAERLRLLRLYKALVSRKLAGEAVVVQSSIELDQARKKSLTEVVREKFGDKKTVFEVDKALIGGLRLINSDTTMDYSIEGKIAQFKEAFE